MRNSPDRGGNPWFEQRLVRLHPEKAARAREHWSESLWWTLVILIGKNEAHPISPGGRLFALAWMGASLFFVSTLTAVITSALTVHELQSSVQGLADLKRVRVVTVDGSSSSDFLENQHIGFRGAATLDEALRQVEREQADVVVYDRPLLLFKVNARYPQSLSVPSLLFAPQNYAIAAGHDSPWLEAINVSLLRRIQDEAWQSIVYSYLGE